MPTNMLGSGCKDLGLLNQGIGKIFIKGVPVWHQCMLLNTFHQSECRELQLKHSQSQWLFGLSEIKSYKSWKKRLWLRSISKLLNASVFIVLINHVG
jgi:hypothetical protein